MSRLGKRGVPLQKYLLSALGFSCVWKIVAYKRIGVALNKKLSDAAAHVGELWCAKRCGHASNSFNSDKQRLM